MTDLTAQTRPLAKTASSECSPGLWRRLTDSHIGFQDAVEALKVDAVELPRFRGELIAAAERLERHAEPCGAKVVMALLVPLVTLYGISDRSQEEWATFWNFYAKALEALPTEAVQAGVAEYVADPKSEFFPKPGPLKAICERHAIPVRMAMSRARQAARSL